MIRKALAVLAYGDLLMLMHNQTRPYEQEAGASTGRQLDRRLTAMFAEDKATPQRKWSAICRRSPPISPGCP